jgi:hypothetical protein
LREEDRYELADGHPIYCAPAGRDHASGNSTGSLVLGTDPAVTWSEIDAGYRTDDGTLHAPDIVVGPSPERDGWIPGAPPLAVEYAGRGQNETELQDRVADLLAAGTRFVWVVRLVGPWRVEVYVKDQPVRTYGAGDSLLAPGILRNPVPVRVLYDRNAAYEETLRNLLQRRGFASLEALQAESEARGRIMGRIEALFSLLEARGLNVTETQRQTILDCQDIEQIGTWLQRAAFANSADALFQ